MQNGTYLVKSKGLEVEYKLVANNGSLKLYDKSRENHYIRTITQFYYDTYLTLVEKLPSPEKKYNIAWYVGGVIKETITINGAYGICKWKIKELQRASRYKLGLLKPVLIQ